MSLNMQELRSRLRNFRTRAKAIDETVSMGEEVLEHIHPMLTERNEGLRWSAARILQEIGSPKSVAALAAALKKDRTAAELVEALRSITGQDFGNDAAAWERWANGEDMSGKQGSPAPAPSITGSTPAHKAIVLEAIRDTSAEIIEEDEQIVVVKVSFSDGRSQRIWIACDQTDPDGEPLLQLCTPCGPADPERYEWALRLNMSIAYGSIAIAQLGDDLCFAIVDSYLKNVVNPAQITKSMLTLANEGDRIEAMLSKQDTY